MLAYALTWTLFIAVARAVPADTPAGYALILLGAYSPGIVALSLTAWEQGGAGVAALARRLFIVDVPARYYAFAVLYMAAIKLSAALLHRVLLGASSATWLTTGLMWLCAAYLLLTRPWAR